MTKHVIINVYVYFDKYTVKSLYGNFNELQLTLPNLGRLMTAVIKSYNNNNNIIYY